MKLSRLLPGVLVTLCLTDIGLRFMPLEPLCFQAWECMARFQEPGSIFQKNAQFRSATTHGNLSNMGNLRDQRQYRPQVFTTDAYGFRNAWNSSTQMFRGILVGDSFAAGYGVSDEETLSAQLLDVAGVHVYNAGGPYAYLATVRRMQARLALTRGFVLVLLTENVPVSVFREAERADMRPGARFTLLRRAFGQENADRLRSTARGLWYTSPLRILTEKAFLRLSNDRILPNTYADRVVRRELSNGDTMLFFLPDVEEFHRARRVEQTVGYLVGLTDRIRESGLDVAVVLAPSKYTVYHPFLEGPRATPGDARHPLARVEATLRRSGIAALDLTPAFRREAEARLAEKSYLYWLDDTHWNRRGVRLAAELIARERLQEGPPRQRRASNLDAAVPPVDLDMVARYDTRFWRHAADHR